MTAAVVVQMSGGVTSWLAARLALLDYGRDRVELLFADTQIEDDDLFRFMADASDDLGLPVTMIADGRDPWEVFRDRRFLGNTRADPCSLVLKRDLLRAWIDEHHPEGAVVVFGMDYTEAHRVGPVTERYAPQHRADFPLIRHNKDKGDAFALLAELGIEPPALNREGFPHNNCGGFCVKAGHGQFALLLRKRPDTFAYHESEEQAFREWIGKDVAVLRDRRGGETRPMTLSELRRRIEDEGYDPPLDGGACGCAIDDEGHPSQLTLSLGVKP